MGTHPMKLFHALLLVVTCCLGAVAAAAQDARLTPFQPVTGTLGAGESARFTFDGVSGQVVSLLASGADELDPAIILFDTNGERLIGADDIAFPDNTDALLQAVTLPRTGRFELEVLAVGGTSGRFTLTLTPGFGTIALQNPFDSADAWQAQGDQAELEVADRTLTLTTAGARARAIATLSGFSAADLAIQVEVSAIDNPAGWSAGIIARRTGDSYYVFELSEEGRWRLSVVVDGTAQVVSDWRSHPAIRPGETAFTLLMMAQHNGFDFFYDGAFIGSVSDDTLTGPGEIGVSAGATDSLASTTVANFSQLDATTPTLWENTAIIPEEVMTGDATTVAQQLVRRHVAQADGVMALTVPTAEVNYARPGVNAFLLGQGTQYTDFAMGANVRINSPISGQVGCGLIFRHISNDETMLAFVDKSGGYGAAERDASGFLPGLFAESSALAGTNAHQLLILADGPRLYYYIDGRSGGTLEISQRAGQVGIAVANFEPAETTCQFENIWIWRWGT